MSLNKIVVNFSSFTFTVSFAVFLPSITALQPAAVSTNPCQTPRWDLTRFPFRKTSETHQFYTKTAYENIH